MDPLDVHDLDEAGLARVPRLLEAATATDGARPVSEAGELALRHRRPGVRHLGVTVGDELVGYAQLTPGGAGVQVEGAVHPSHRSRGIGTALVEAVVRAAGAGEGGGTVLAWAHGDHPGAAALAARVGAARERELWQMRRPLRPDDATGAAGPDDPPEGVVLRPFVVGRDEQAWLAVNAAAFAHHPEQGATTLDDLRERQGEAWFDPGGFLLAEDAVSGELLGFHWTKVHPASAEGPAAGEVYVLGVAPAAQGRRLGGALLRAGLAHLATTRDPTGAPLEEVLLYVEADNVPAVALYRRQGLEVAHVDVRYALAPST